MEYYDKMAAIETDRERMKKRAQLKNVRIKKLRYKLVIGVLATTIVGGFVIKNKLEENNQQAIQTIVDYYGEDSEENRIIKYINLSETLNKLNLDDYDVDKSLFSKYDISDELKSPEEIENLIEQQKLINSFISSKNITKQSKNIDIILNLIKQEQLVNDYIYTTGYSIANQDAKKSTKEYVGEVFGIDDYNNLEFDYAINSVDASQDVNIFYNSDEGPKSYSFDSFFMSSKEDKIMDGINSISNTNTYNDNIDDNDEYNEYRNELIRNAIEKSAILGYEVDEKDLYSEELSRKLK